MVVAPGYSYKPENGVLYTDVPFYNQGYYFKQGWEFIKRDPARLLDNFGHVGNLFFADMLPTRFDAPGFASMRPAWDWFKFIMFMTLGLYVWSWRELGTRRDIFWLSFSMIALTLIESFFFTGEPRYTYSILFAFYLLFFKIVEILQFDWRRWVRPVAIYASLLVVVFAAGEGWRFMEPKDEATLALSVYSSSSSPITAHVAPMSYEISDALFPFAKEFPMTDASGDVTFPDRPAQVRLHGALEVKDDKPLPIQFEINSSWPARFFIDGRPIMEVNSSDYFSEAVTHPTLSPGVYDVELVFDYLPQSGGFAMNYSYWDNGWRERGVLGQDTPKIHFLPLAQTDAGDAT
jgi:hypothetical protein